MSAALTMKGAVFCSNMMLELDFREGFGSVAPYIDNTSALHVAGNRACSPRAKHIALRYFFGQELVEGSKITVHFMKTYDQIADLGTKHANEHGHRAVVKFIEEFES